MADNPTDEIDVTSITSQIQGSLAASLLPDLESVANLTKQVSQNLVDANSAANLDITGIDNIKEMQNSLVGSQAALEQSMTFAKKFRVEISQATDKEQAGQIIKNASTRMAEKIAEKEALRNDHVSNRIPFLEDQVKFAQSTLDLMTAGTPEYEQQAQALAAAQEELETGQVALSAVNGQLLAATKYQDEFLAGQEIMLKNAESMSQYQFGVKQAVGATIQESRSLLQVNQQLKDELDDYGNQMQNFMKNYGPVADQVMNGFDNIANSITGTLDQIPLIGGLLSSYAIGPLGEAADMAKNAFAGALKESFKIMEDGGSMTEAIAGGMSSFVQGLQGMGSVLSKLLSGPFLLITAIAGLLFLAFQRFGKLEEGARDFRKEVGGTLDAVRPITEEVQRLSVEFAHMGVTIEDGFKAASALTEKFGTFGLKVMPGAIETVALLSTQLGVTDANAAGAMEKFRMMGVAAGESANNITMAVASAANLAGVNADEVMADIAGASEEALVFMGQTPGALAAAAVKAKQLGTSLNDVASTMEQMLDFESSMNKEMQLSTMLGSHISMERLRQLSFAGDAEGVMKEQSRLLKSMGGLENMNALQKKAAAEALGTSVENLMKMEQSEKDQAAFRAKYGDEAIALEKELEALRGGETKDAADRMKQQLKEQVQQEKMNQLKNEFNSMMIKLGEKLLPMVEVGMALLVPILGTIFDVIGYILYPFELLGKAIDYISNALKPVVDALGEVGNALGMVGDAGDVVGKVIGSIVGGFLMFKFMIKPIMSLFTDGISGAFKKIFEVASSASGKVGEMLKNIAGGVGDALKKVGSTIGDIATSIGKGIAGLAKGIGEGIAAIFKGIGTGIESLVNSLKNLNATNMLKAAGALLLLGGAMFVSAKAFQEFANVSWDSVMKGTIVLGAMTLAAVALGKAGPQIIKGAVAIGLLGLSLIPAAYAFGLFADVSWPSVFTAIGAISLLAIVAGILGAPPIIGFVLAGALAIGALGLAMIPFAAAALIAGYAAGLVADAFVKMAGSLSELTLEQVGVIFALGGAFVFLGAMFPFIVMGAAALGAVTFALLGFGVASNVIAPGIALLADGFDSFAVSLSKISMENVLAFGALGVTFAGFALLLPAIAAGAVTVGIMAWSIGKLGDAAGEAAPGINSFAEGLNPVIDKMLMISDASEKMRDASSVIREVGSAMSDLGKGQMVQAAGGVVESAGGFLSGMFNSASDKLFGTETVEKSKEGPIDKMIRLGESMGNLQGIDGTLQNVRSSVEAFTDVNVAGLATVGSGIKMLIHCLETIDVGSLTILDTISASINNMANSVTKITEESVNPIKSFLKCISDPDIFSVAVSGFDSLTESIIKFGEALDNISLIKLAMLGLVSKTDEAEKKLSEQPEIAEVISNAESSASVPTPISEVTQTTTTPTPSITQQQQTQPEIGEVVSNTEGPANIPTPISEVTQTTTAPTQSITQQQQTQQETAVDLAQKGYIFANFVEKIGGEDRLQQLQAANDKIDELSVKMVNLTNQAVTQADPLDPDSKLTFATQVEEQQFQKLNREIETARADRFKMKMEMTNDAMRGLSNSNKALAASSFNRQLERSLFDLDLIQDAEAENRLLERNASPVTLSNEVLSQSITEGIESTQSNAGAGFELPSPATAPSVTETLATVNQPATQAPVVGGGSEVDVSGVENNLVELISLMKSGGIAVYLDSKKVSKGLAAAAEQ